MEVVVAGGGGGGPPATVIVNVCVKVETAPSVSVTVQLAVPVTGDVLAARPVTVTVPSPLSTAPNEGSVGIEKEAADTVPPLGVTPSAASGVMVPMLDWPTFKVRVFMVEAPEKLMAMDFVRRLGRRRRSSSSTSR